MSDAKFFISYNNEVKKCTGEVLNMPSLVAQIKGKYQDHQLLQDADDTDITIMVVDRKHDVKYQLEDTNDIEDGTQLEITLKSSAPKRGLAANHSQPVKRTRVSEPVPEDGSHMVKLSGLPFGVSRAEIASFLQGVVTVPDSTFIATKANRPTGVAFVQCQNMANRNMALSKDRSYMGRRYVDVTASTYKEVKAAKKRAHPWEGVVSGMSVILKLVGIPFSADEDDIQEFLSSASGVIGVHIVTDRQARAIGTAFIEFESKDQAEVAMQTLQGQTIGSRYIDLKHANQAQLIHAMGGVVTASTLETKAIVAPAHLVRMSGVPFSATETECKAFFEGLTVNQVHIIRDVLGRNSGDVLVELPDQTSVQAALQMDKKHMGSRYINMHTATAQEYIQAVQGSQLGAGAGAGQFAEHIVRMGGLPFSAGEEEVRSFLAGVQIRKVHFGKDRTGRNNGFAFLELDNVQEVEKALAFHKQFIDSRYINVIRSDVNQLRGCLGLSSGTTRGGGQLLSSKVLHMKGLPYSASEQDIQAFFSSAGVVPSLIHRQPGAGEAFAEFASPQVATRAFSLHRKNMGRRYIELTSVPYARMASVVGLPMSLPMQMQAMQMQRMQAMNMHRSQRTATATATATPDASAARNRVLGGGGGGGAAAQWMQQPMATGYGGFGATQEASGAEQYQMGSW